MIRTPRWVVQILGAVFAIEGLVGLVDPDAFRGLVVWLQTPPAWPYSVIARAILGFVLLVVAVPVRSLMAVRVVGVLTILGAIVGLIFTNLDQTSPGAIWRLPSLILLVAGAAVFWGARRPR